MRRIAPIAAVVLTLTVCGAGAPAVAFEKHQNTITDPNLIPPPFTAPEPYTPPGVIGRGERLEMRSYLPYSGLQKGFRPPPPMQHGVVTDRPEIVQPIPLAPLMEYADTLLRAVVRLLRGEISELRALDRHLYDLWRRDTPLPIAAVA